MSNFNSIRSKTKLCIDIITKQPELSLWKVAICALLGDSITNKAESWKSKVSFEPETSVKYHNIRSI